MRLRFPDRRLRILCAGLMATEMELERPFPCSSSSKEATAPSRAQQKDEEEAGRIHGGFESFPEELLQQVLSYLPFPDMIRVRIVCRSWLSALTSPSFLPLWSRKSAPTLWLLRFDCADSCLFAFHPLSNLCLPLPRPSAPYSIVAISQGLICSYHPSSNALSISLFNPLSRASLPIPVPNSILPSFNFGFIRQRLPLERFYIIACDFSRSHPAPHAKLYDSALRNWVTLHQPPAVAPPDDQLPRSTQLFVWWNGKFCILSSDRVVTYDVSTSQWGTIDLPYFPRIWNSRYMTLHAIRGRLFLEGNFQGQGDFQTREQLHVGILELDRTTLQWREIAHMPEEFAKLLCRDTSQPLHSKYTAYSDADCDHMCFSPFPTLDKEQLVFYNVEENFWTSMQIRHTGWHSYFGSSNFKGWALQPDFTALS